MISLLRTHRTENLLHGRLQVMVYANVSAKWTLAHTFGPNHNKNSNKNHTSKTGCRQQIGCAPLYTPSGEAETQDISETKVLRPLSNVVSCSPTLTALDGSDGTCAVVTEVVTEQDDGTGSSVAEAKLGHHTGGVAGTGGGGNGMGAPSCAAKPRGEQGGEGREGGGNMGTLPVAWGAGVPLSARFVRSKVRCQR